MPADGRLSAPFCRPLAIVRDEMKHAVAASEALVEPDSRAELKRAVVDLTVVVPVFDEAESVTELYSGLREVLEHVAPNWEIIFVDDGSRDGTLERLEDVCASDRRVQAIGLRRN